MKTERIEQDAPAETAKEAPSRKPTPEEAFFLEQAYKNPVDSIERIEETAKFMVTVLVAVSGLLAAACKMAEGENAASQRLWWLPFVIWVAACFCWVIVLFPTAYGIGKQDPASIKAAYRKMLGWKYAWLAAGLVLFGLGLFCAVLPIP